MTTNYKFEASCVFDGFRIDHFTVEAKDDKSAKMKVKMRYKPKFRRCVTSIHVRRLA